MAITVNGYDGNPFTQASVAYFDRTIRTIYRLAFSGSYATSGDTLDFTNGGVNSAVPGYATKIISVVAYGNGTGSTITALGGIYVPTVGTAITNWLLEIFKVGGTQYSAGAYSTDVTGDVVFLEVNWARD